LYTPLPRTHTQDEEEEEDEEDEDSFTRPRMTRRSQLIDEARRSIADLSIHEFDVKI
jgi:hypothetical protein